MAVNISDRKNVGYRLYLLLTNNIRLGLSIRAWSCVVNEARIRWILKELLSLPLDLSEINKQTQPKRKLPPFGSNIAQTAESNYRASLS